MKRFRFEFFFSLNFAASLLTEVLFPLSQNVSGLLTVSRAKIDGQGKRGAVRQRKPPESMMIRNVGLVGPRIWLGLLVLAWPMCIKDQSILMVNSGIRIEKGNGTQ